MPNERMKAARKEKGFSQDDLARAVPLAVADLTVV